jgi:hydroxymethylbilane synthase
VPEREDPRDVFLSNAAGSLRDLPKGAVLGTASLRRQAQALRIRPDLRIEVLRGNVETRLRKLGSGIVDATLLAAAGLRRLGLMRYATGLMNPEDMLPAVAQGAIGIEIRADDMDTRDLLAPLNHEASAACVLAERAFLAVLEGSCKTPIAALAEIDEAGALRLRARLLAPDGGVTIEATRLGAVGDSVTLGRDAGAEIRSRASPELLAGLPGIAS